MGLLEGWRWIDDVRRKAGEGAPRCPVEKFKSGLLGRTCK